MGNNDCKLAGNTGKEYIRFRGDVIPGFSSGNTHVDLQVVDGTFHNDPDLVKRIPFIGIPLDAGKHAEIEIFIGIGGTSPFWQCCRDYCICRSTALFRSASWDTPI